MIRGSDEWYAVVRSSPYFDAERMLRDYKYDLLLEQARNHQMNQSEVGAMVGKANSEIHRLAQLQGKAQLRHAIKNVVDQETYEAILTELARLEHMVKDDHVR